MEVAETYFLWNGVRFMPRLLDIPKVVFPVEVSHDLRTFSSHKFCHYRFTIGLTEEWWWEPQFFSLITFFDIRGSIPWSFQCLACLRIFIRQSLARFTNSSFLFHLVHGSDWRKNQEKRITIRNALKLPMTEFCKINQQLSIDFRRWISRDNISGLPALSSASIHCYKT